jgi:ABC-2 type transport system permease protein
MRSVLAKSWHDKSRGLIGWIVGIVSLVALSVMFWPSIRDNDSFKEVFEDLPDSLKFLIGQDQLTSPIGYMDSKLFLYTIPIFFLSYGIGRGADAIAGEEQRHTLDLLLAHPITRGRVILEKFGAICLGLLVMTAALFVSTAIGVKAYDMDLAIEDIAAACFASWLLGLLFAALALLLGAASGKRSIAVGATSAAAATAYFLNSLAPQVEALGTIRKLSPFYYYAGDSPLKQGFAFGDLSVLIAVTAFLLAAAIWLFDRRDVHV